MRFFSCDFFFFYIPRLGCHQKATASPLHGVVTGQKVKNKNLIHTHICTSQPLRHTYSLSPTFILTYISLDKTSFHSLTRLFHSYNLPTHSRLAGSLQPCTFRHANFLSCFLGRKTTERQGFPALCSPSL